DKRVRGCKILSVWLGSKPEPFRSTPEEIAAVLTGSTIVGVRRVGKHIVADLTREKGKANKVRKAKPDSKSSFAEWRGQWIVHLGMTGQLLVAKPEVPVPPHTHAIVQLDDGREIRFVDPRRFGRLSVLEISDNQRDPKF